MTYNRSRGLRKQARGCVPIFGDCSRLGPPKPWTRTFPEPRFKTAKFKLLSVLIFSSYLHRRCQSIQSSTNLPWHAFLDDKSIVALAFTRPSYLLFTFSEQLVPCKVCGNESSPCENEQLQCIHVHRLYGGRFVWKSIYYVSIPEKKNSYG